MRKFFSHAALCIMAILVIALCGCDDLGEFADPEEYYASFGDVIMIDGVTKDTRVYSVEEYFYNNESREDFLVGEDGVYNGPLYANYVYVAIPFESSIDMDSLALYIRSEKDVTVYISAFVVDKIPSKWKPITDENTGSNGTSGGSNSGAGNGEEPTYDDPNRSASIAEVTVNLQKGKWNSFLLENFKVDGNFQKSVQINDGQIVLLQIRNNSGVRIFDTDKETFVDPVTGLKLEKAEITMTNLLVRALEVISGDNSDGGD